MLSAKQQLCMGTTSACYISWTLFLKEMCHESRDMPPSASHSIPMQHANSISYCVSALLPSSHMQLKADDN